MPIRCHAEHDGQGIVLSQISCADDATSLRCFFVEKGAQVVTAEPDGPEDFRLILFGISIAEFSKLIAGSNIELI